MYPLDIVASRKATAICGMSAHSRKSLPDIDLRSPPGRTAAPRSHPTHRQWWFVRFVKPQVW
jgi:hypothetical protein